MNAYRHILAAIDLSDEAVAVVERAALLAACSQATLSLVHVREPLTYAYGGELPVDFSNLEGEIQKQAEQRLQELGEPLGIPAERRFCPTGRTAAEIQRLCEEHAVDLIVIGCHGRQGLALLLGSTTNSLLRGVRTDVLAVRVGS